MPIRINQPVELEALTPSREVGIVQPKTRSLCVGRSNTRAQTEHISRQHDKVDRVGCVLKGNDIKFSFEEEVKIAKITFVVRKLIRIQWPSFPDEKVIANYPILGRTVELVREAGDGVPDVLGGIIYSALEIKLANFNPPDDLAFVWHERSLTLYGSDGVGRLFSRDRLHDLLRQLPVLYVIDDSRPSGIATGCVRRLLGTRYPGHQKNAEYADRQTKDFHHPYQLRVVNDQSPAGLAGTSPDCLDWGKYHLRLAIREIDTKNNGHHPYKMPEEEPFTV